MEQGGEAEDLQYGASQHSILGRGGCGSTRQAGDSGWGLAVSQEMELGLTHIQNRQWCL